MSKPNDPDSPNWFENPERAEHIERLLEESGAILESLVSKECRSFAHGVHKKQGVSVHSHSITYGLDTQEAALRQIDQSVQLYKEFILDDRTGVALNIEIPIEVKYRRDVESIGIDFPP